MSVCVLSFDLSVCDDRFGCCLVCACFVLPYYGYVPFSGRLFYVVVVVGVGGGYCRRSWFVRVFRR